MCFLTSIAIPTDMQHAYFLHYTRRTIHPDTGAPSGDIDFTMQNCIIIYLKNLMCTNVMKFQGIFRQSSLKIVGVLNGALDYFCTQILHYFHLRVPRQHSLRLAAERILPTLRAFY